MDSSILDFEKKKEKCQITPRWNDYFTTMSKWLFEYGAINLSQGFP